ncbi:hypothetical protein BX661DRAFT_27558 [Kickxella alabastrina]|uniref:uncharacterized protein n=1 Tax=Kickxella alabastrina TaxID=61397 RepID=UPI00221EA778|nr:uncharacterized protein BX661DRAFT_27558 [Kickxella alabastrina]KAI7826636.1 hypothetical protein BX661DRAFT_27558 [Kickxella alabastrina]
MKFCCAKLYCARVNLREHTLYNVFLFLKQISLPRNFKLQYFLPNIFMSLLQLILEGHEL